MAPARSGVRAARHDVLRAPRSAFTVGHGTLAAPDFLALVHGAGIEAIADVRTAPGSRHNPQFGRKEMAEWLNAAGMTYTHYKELGGWRRAREDSPNVALRNAAFRGYADYMLMPEFSRAVDVLVPQLETKPTALMCSESVWWRCHRRLLADYLVLVRGWEILDLMHDGRAEPHVLTPGVRSAGDRLYYDALATT